MKVKVTQKHIQDGKRFSIRMCPIALAIKEQFNAFDVIVTQHRAIFINTETGIKEVWELSKRAQEFISKFDAENDMSSANFVLRREE